jgi:hypothetical protein
MENGWGKERTMNSEPASPILVAVEEGVAEAKSSANGRFYKLYLIHTIST